MRLLPFPLLCYVTPNIYPCVLQVQRVVRPVLGCALVVAVLHPLWNWLLVYHFDYGLTGAAMATSVSQV